MNHVLAGMAFAGVALAAVAGCTETNPAGSQVVGSRAARGKAPSTTAGGDCPADGGPCVVLLEGKQHMPAGLAVEGSTVYFTNYDGKGGDLDGQILSAPVGGGPATTLVSHQVHPLALAVDATSLYWTDTGHAVVKAALDGSGVTTLASSQDLPYGISLDAAHVYWSNQAGDQGTSAGTVLALPKAGGTPTTLVSGRDSPRYLATDGTSVFWIDSGDPSGIEGSCLMKVPVGGGEATTLANNPDPLAYLDVVVAGSTAYFTDNDDGLVLSVPVAGGPVVTLASGRSEPEGLAVDGVWVYWVEGTGPVAKVPVAGGKVTTLAVSIGVPGTIAVGGKSAYWTVDDIGKDGLGGDVFKVTPK